MNGSLDHLLGPNGNQQLLSSLLVPSNCRRNSEEKVDNVQRSSERSGIVCERTPHHYVADQAFDWLRTPEPDIIAKDV
jgi:hypothetical protein